jgi:ABC-type transport system involved in cytochrome bd biosynthesis fused ATPase/permease subunit
MNITVPIWMNYDKYMLKIKEEGESKVKELAIAKKNESLRASFNNIEEKYKRKTKSKQHFGGVYKGSNVVYMYPTLNTIIQGVETKLFKNKLNIQILYSSIKKILHISYNKDLPEAYNTISIVTGSTRNTKKVMRHNADKKGRVINVLDRTLLYKNKDLLKELYTNIKNGHRVKVSPPKSSSSSIGSIGYPPKS